LLRHLFESNEITIIVPRRGGKIDAKGCPLEEPLTRHDHQLWSGPHPRRLYGSTPRPADVLLAPTVGESPPSGDKIADSRVRATSVHAATVLASELAWQAVSGDSAVLFGGRAEPKFRTLAVMSPGNRRGHWQAAVFAHDFRSATRFRARLISRCCGLASFAELRPLPPKTPWTL